MSRASGTGGSSAPVIANALRAARLITIAGGGTGAAEVTTDNIASMIQTVLAAQLVTRGGILDASNSGNGGSAPTTPVPPAASRR